MKKKILLLSALVGGMTATYAQRWEPSSQRTSQINKAVEVQHAYRVDLQSLRDLLKEAVETGKNAKPVIISLPTAEGKIERFAVYSNPVMEKSLADLYQLGSYVGVGVDDPDKYVRLSTSPQNMQSMMIKEGKFQFIEPISTDSKTYGVFYKTKEEGKEHGFKCDTSERNFKDINKLIENGKKQLSSIGIAKRPTNTRYRSFRMAMAVTGEYSQYQLTAANTPANATDDVKRGVVLAAVNNTMTRINGVFEKDFGAHFNVQNLPNLLYLDPATDFYTSTAPESLNLQLQRTLTTQVTDANYDIGHVFHCNAGGSRNGNAGGIGIVCKNPVNNDDEESKGAAFSMSPTPAGEVFDLVAAHEMGHQLGANHTFSMYSEQTGANVEPGGGGTIMGYPGITYDNVQMDMFGYFHYKSLDQVLTNLESKPACGTQTVMTVNTAPVISALTNYTIPSGTAYYLDATAVDAQNDPMNFTWEQNNSVDEFASISGDSGWGYNPQGALAKSLEGTPSGRRYFPKLATVMAGSLTNKQDWETVSYIPRVLNYAVTVRDQNTQQPMTSSAETTVTVGNNGPFKFNGLTSSSVLYNNAVNTIYWDTVNTNTAPYNVANVKIDYTADNGTTWTDLVASAPNTGSYVTQLPGNLTGTIKLRISAIGNIFYAVSPAIKVGKAPISLTDAPSGVSTLDTEVFKTTARVSWNNTPGTSYSVNYRKMGASNWLNATSQTNSIVLNSLDDESNYEVKVATVVNNVPGAFSDVYTFKTKGLKTGIDYCILNTGYSYVGAIRGITVANINHDNPGARAYKDLSENPNLVIDLTQGNSYNLTPYIYQIISGQDLPVNVSVWIDYNRNGNFEASERVISVSEGAPMGVVSFGQQNFTVPTNTYSGDKLLRMRVVAKYGAASLDNTCGQLESGAGGIMDLPVRIAANTLAVSEVKNVTSEVSIYPNPADTFIEVKNLKGKADYKIYSADGRLVQEGKVEGRINVASLLKGMYVVTIKDNSNTYNTKLIKK